MRAFAVFPDSGDARVIDVDEPLVTRSDEMKLRVLDVGICGTDREIAAGAYGTPPDDANYLILGHESPAEVVEAGSDTGFSPGDLVVPTVRRPCPHAYCTACRNQQQDFCLSFNL